MQRLLQRADGRHDRPPLVHGAKGRSESSTWRMVASSNPARTASSWRGAANMHAWSRHSFSATRPQSRACRRLKSQPAATRRAPRRGRAVALWRRRPAGGSGRRRARSGWREREGKEDGARRGERFGVAGPRASAGAAHLGACGKRRRDGRGRAAGRPPDRDSDSAVLLTTGTVTAAEVAKRRLPDRRDPPVRADRHAGLGRPLPRSLASRPRAFCRIGALADDAARACAGARCRLPSSTRACRSARSARGSAVAPLARAVIGQADLFLAQTLADAERLKALGASRVVVCGNLKFDAPPPPADDARGRRH